ncbi:class I SAM-dependent methyltransferase, partial [Frankia sp. CiP1_Cm_nod1]
MDAAQWDRRHAGTGLLWTAEPNQVVVEHLTGLTPGRALDLACGEGRNAVWLATQGWRVTGVDFSQVAIRKARELSRRFDVTPEWIHADVMVWTPRPASYELVIICYLHLAPEQRRDVLRCAVDATVPGGTLLVIGHDRANLRHGDVIPADPELLLDADDLLTELAAGPPLRISRAGRVRGPLRGDGNRHPVVDTLLVGRRPGPVSP